VFEGASPVAILMAHVRDDPVPPSEISELDIPPELDEVILACLEKDPENRPNTAMELYSSLCCIPVPPWNSATALEWWKMHLPDLMSQAEVTPITGIAPVLVEPDAVTPSD
jgi:serine/threonine-protein kinase